VKSLDRLDDAVAVVADHMAAAKKGLAGLVIEWDDGPHECLTTDPSRISGAFVIARIPRWPAHAGCFSVQAAAFAYFGTSPTRGLDPDR
jgi:hypothetical protein